MNTLTIEKQEGPDEVTLRVSGRVDVGSAAMLRGCVESLAGRRLVLDFSRGDLASDAALGAFIDAAPTQKLVCRGLRSHHERIVQYLCTQPFPRA
jgi:hypothetical protein